jgi:pyridoxine kinase
MDVLDVCRVLSIQSHVVSGYVGNKSATFPLQVLGFEVDTINSVQFSNHTGYPLWKGQVLNAQDLTDLYDGLNANKLNFYSHLLTGYIGSASFLLEVKRVIQDLKTANPDLVYVCDPVMGDLGKLYVPEELLSIYRESIVPLADIVTPNQFEAELLTGLKITDLASAQIVMLRLHELGVKTVVISSTELGSDQILVQLASRILADGTVEAFQVDIPRLDAEFTGTGDLFAALLLAWMKRIPDDLKLVCEKVVSTMQLVLRRTLASAQAMAGQGNVPTPAMRELKLVQSKADIENPNFSIVAFPMSTTNGPLKITPKKPSVRTAVAMLNPLEANGAIHN